MKLEDLQQLKEKVDSALDARRLADWYRSWCERQEKTEYRDSKADINEINATAAEQDLMELVHKIKENQP